MKLKYKGEIPSALAQFLKSWLIKNIDCTYILYMFDCDLANAIQKEMGIQTWIINSNTNINNDKTTNTSHNTLLLEVMHLTKSHFLNFMKMNGNIIHTFYKKNEIQTLLNNDNNIKNIKIIHQTNVN